ncbi:MAG: translation initiation factor Sui1 [Candidatus Latescibacter sp.]|nr:translation initiation factor Sui1 [Candidatus Latescibacter sp.]
MPIHRSNQNRRVYSTEKGRLCPSCGQPAASCGCGKIPVNPQGDGIVRVRRDVKGRGGKTVTTVSGFPLDESGIRELASQFKRRLGTGGTVKGGVMEIQGDYSGVLITELTKLGFTVKRAGG